MRRTHRRGEPQKLPLCSADLLLESWVRNIAGAEDPYFTLFQPKICRNSVGEEFVAMCERAGVVLAKIVLALIGCLRMQEAVAARPLARPLNAPLHGADHTV